MIQAFSPWSSPSETFWTGCVSDEPSHAVTAVPGQASPSRTSTIASISVDSTRTRYLPVAGAVNESTPSGESKVGSAQPASSANMKSGAKAHVSMTSGAPAASTFGVTQLSPAGGGQATMSVLQSTSSQSIASSPSLSRPSSQ